MKHLHELNDMKVEIEDAPGENLVSIRGADVDVHVYQFTGIDGETYLVVDVDTDDDDAVRVHYNERTVVS